ncbi:hypothetical protein ACP4OV_031803 [Aristida adscensionis]
MASCWKALLLWASLALAAAACSEARDFVVGGANAGWDAPPQADSLARWAAANRFHIGDNLVFGAAESVLEVTRDDYNRCSTASPIAAHRAAPGAGAVTVPLPRSGAFYFVGGAAGSCQKGERVVVVVMSEKHGRSGGHHGFFAPAQAPAPAESPLAAALVGGPAAAPAPATGAAGGSTGGGAMLLAAAVLGAVMVGFGY